MTVLDELTPHYLEILDMMPDEFDSHHFILTLAHHYQPEYVRALAACLPLKDDAPFREVHKQISQSLRGYAEYVGGDYVSDDIFRFKQANALWRKRKS